MNDKNKAAPAPVPAPPKPKPDELRDKAREKVETVVKAVPLPVTAPAKPKTEEQRDSVREMVETVVFVVVLVLLLKTFVAEAFVIPTGSMAETLYGIQLNVTCPECGYGYPVNCSHEVQPPAGEQPREVIGCTCPNCRYQQTFGQNNPKPGWSNGDRVLVAKYPFDNGHLSAPKRFDTAVFKFPKEPVQRLEAMNYIKRIVGLPGETIGIYGGDAYVTTELTYPHRSPRKDELERWEFDNTYLDDQTAKDAFRAGKFQIIRKPPDKMLAERRIVYHNDYQAKDLHGPQYQRWAASAPPAEAKATTWKADNPDAAKVFSHASAAGDGWHWVRYHHLLPSPISRLAAPAKSVIYNFMGYNTFEPNGEKDGPPARDLMLEATAQVQSDQGEIVLELGYGNDRFQARFRASDGQCQLWRLGAADEVPLGEPKPTALRPGERKYVLRFANFDRRLVVWVDGKLAFGTGVDYDEPRAENFGTSALPLGATANDPVGIGARGGVALTVSNLQIWRDTYYTPQTSHTEQRWWNEYNENGKDKYDGVLTMYVQPGHYLALGDNSSQSSDSRYWGLVPQRLLLGRALVIYWPYTRFGLIR